MRHFFGFRADGSLGSLHTYHGGWPANMDLRETDSIHPTVQNQRAASKPDIIGFVPFDCMCKHEQGVCDCLGAAHRTKFVKDGALVDKPSTTVVQIDGVVAVDGERFIRAPGTKLQFQVICPDVPDGQKLNVYIKGALLHPDANHVLTVSGGLTPALELTAPAQGSFGQVVFGGIQFIPAQIDVVGFA